MHRRTGKRPIVVAYGVMSGALLALYGASEWWIASYGNAQVHTLLELAATGTALFTAVLALVRFHTRQNNAVLFLGAAFMGTAILDGYHMLVTSEFFSRAFPSSPASLIPWSWSASRSYLALTMFLGFLAWDRESRLGITGRVRPMRIFLLGAAICVLSGSFFALVPLGRAYYPELFYSRPQELIPALLFAAALAGYAAKVARKPETIDYWITASLIVGLACQTLFMSRSVVLFDTMFNVAHLLKLLSYLLVLIGLLQDVYQAWRSEQHARDLAIAASRAKSEFLANMSHEVRTPINAIQGFTDLLLDGNLTPVQRDYLTTMSESADSLLQIVNDILDFSKIEAGKLELDEEPFEVRELVGETLKSLALKAERQGLELACRIDPSVPARVVGEPRRLRQILVNLIGNAIKFTEAGQVIVTVDVHSTKPHPISNSDETIQLHISVADTGIGIAEEELDTIFQAFEQADSSATRRFGGTGLGLAITSRLLDEMGGTIWVESQLGQGSTFYVSVPMARVGDRQSSATVLPPKAMGMRTLVVDHRPTSSTILCELLAAFGMNPQRTENGKDALRRLAEAAANQQPYKLVISHASLPDLTGLDLFAAIQREQHLGPPAAILVSPAGQMDDPKRLAALGIAAHCTMPVKQSELAAAIRAAVGKRSNRPATPDGPAGDQTIPARSPQLRILLAEDSRPNQKLALALLERAGHTVEVAETGRAAVKLALSRPFDVILMDVQMPVLDGLAATAEIRANRLLPGSQTPIIAMTAHALKGDRQRCLAAGMDDYLSKPIDRKELFAALSRIVPTVMPPNLNQPPPSPTPAGPTATEATVQPAGNPTVPWDDLLETVGGSADVLADIVDAYAEEMNEMLARLPTALEQGDADAVMRLAHKLKSGLRFLRQGEVVQWCQRLENCGASSDLQHADRLLAEIVPRVRALQKAIPAARPRTV